MNIFFPRLFIGGLLIFFIWFLLFLPTLNASQYKPYCSIRCKTDSVCMNTSPLKAACIPRPSTTPISGFLLPFNARTEVTCTHSSGSGTHSWRNAFWAIDLATPYNQPAATIYASSNGIAYVSRTNCPEPQGTPANANASRCGDGWGNWVKILHKNGYFTFYAHLDRVLIKNRTFVRQGEPIGVEGWTGSAGHRHLHWSVQKLPGTKFDWRNEITTYAGDSVPFDFQAIQNGQVKIFSIKKIKCEHANIGQTGVIHQPTFRGQF